MSTCGVPWPVCPDCPGARVWESAGHVRCERCGREWPESERVPCPDPATVALTDAGGGATPRLVCFSHSRHPSAADLCIALRPIPGGRGRCPYCGSACDRVDDPPLPPGVIVRAWSGPAYVCRNKACGRTWSAEELGNP